jgi:hypothetical protein
VPGWLTATLVVAPIAAWLSLLVAGTLVVGPFVLYAVVGAYMLGICLALAVTNRHRRAKVRHQVHTTRR